MIRKRTESQIAPGAAASTLTKLNVDADGCVVLRKDKPSRRRTHIKSVMCLQSFQQDPLYPLSSFSSIQFERGGSITKGSFHKSSTMRDSIDSSNISFSYKGLKAFHTKFQFLKGKLTGSSGKDSAVVSAASVTKGVPIHVPKNCEFSVDTIELSVALSCRDFVDAFMDFLTSEYSEENLEFWLEVQSFKCNVLPLQLHTDAERIFDLFISDNCPKPINIDANARSAIVKLVNYPNSSMFDTCEEQVYNLMKRDCFPRFLRSDYYRNSTRDLPYFSHKNLQSCPIIGGGSTGSSSTENTVFLAPPYSKHPTNQLSPSNPDISKFEDTPPLIKDEDGKHTIVLIPKFNEKFTKNRLSVIAGSCRFIVNDRNYTLPVKEAKTIGQLFSMLNLPIKNPSTYLAFLHPQRKIIDTTQKSAYYSGKTFEFKRFSRLSMVLGTIICEVYAPWDLTVIKAIESVAFKLGIDMAEFSGFKLKNKKGFTAFNSCGTYDKMTIIGVAHKK